MTKDQYFEMCEMVGSEPKEEEIPIEFEDLNEDVQEVIGIYNMLRDNWDSMSGVYLGKDFAGIQDILNIMGIEDSKSCFFIIQIIDNTRSIVLNNKKPAK